MSIRHMTDEELDYQGWDGNEPIMVLELDDGSILYPSKDYEGNDGGAIFGRTKDETFVLYTE